MECSGESNSEEIKRQADDISGPDSIYNVEELMEIEFLEETELTGVNHLPDEILENIFTRLSRYDDLDSIKVVCRRWNKVAKEIIHSLKIGFHQAILNGTLECVKKSAVYNDNNRIVGFWISQRFGQMCCSYNNKIYITGGTTHTPTTFNDMWNFDLNSRLWCRIIPNGTYPSPKALGTFVTYKDNLVLFGGWSHPPPYPLMQPWRIFDELHIYNVTDNRWSVNVSNGPPPSAGHSATVQGDMMVTFGGRTFDQGLQSYPLSNSVWTFNFMINEWNKLIIISDDTRPAPAPRYGHTQIAVDDSHLLIIGGCGGPNQIFSDVWLLAIERNRRGKQVGTWREMSIVDVRNSITLDFHFSGCKVDDTVIFFERSSPISPFLAFLHFGSQTPAPPEQRGITFEADRSCFNCRCSSGLKTPVANATMPIYSLDISKVLTDGTVNWYKEPVRPTIQRPSERFLYSMVAGRSEIILFGGFFKEKNGKRCRVSSDLFFLGTPHKCY